MKRFSCDCEACDDIITKPWDYSVRAGKQELFADLIDSYFKPLLEDDNTWHFIDLKERNETDKEDVE